MLLTITTTHTPATDLGYLLHKHPSRAQTFPLPFGQAHVFYPEASEERCTAALLLDVDPIALVRGRREIPGAESGLLIQYVNDRPYVASSFLSVALARVFGAALAGRSTERPELVAQPLPLCARLVPLPCQGARRCCGDSSPHWAIRSAPPGTRSMCSMRTGDRAATLRSRWRDGVGSQTS